MRAARTDMTKKAYKETRYVTRIYVWASSPVGVFEGCRYDSCYPNSEADSHKLEALINHHRQTPEDHFICLSRAARIPGPPTIDRWRSFNCRVLMVQHPDESPPTQAELANLFAAPLDHPSLAR